MHRSVIQSVKKKDCDSTKEDSCVWCECEAVPSICVTTEESKSLPPDVFKCDSTPSPDGHDNKNDNDELMYDFGLNDGRIIQLRENIMESGSNESEFCDSSSKSISGYLDVKGSKVVEL